MQYVQYIKAHDCKARLFKGRLFVIDEHFTPDGCPVKQVVELPMRWSAVRNWLGY